MKTIVVDYRPGMSGLTFVPIYQFNGMEDLPKQYHLTNDWEQFKEALTDLCHSENTFDVVFYGNANTIPYTEEELKQEFKDFEHKKYANAANLNIRIELC